MKFNFTKFITRLGLQIVSLFIAVVLWLYAVGEQSVEVTLKVPLRVSPPAGRMTVLSSSLQNITLRLSVSRNILSVVSQQSVHAYHEIKGVEKAGEYNFRIEPRDIVLPPGNIRILDINPVAVTVTLDQLIVQKLPVKVLLNGEPAHGYLIDKEKMDVNPNAVLIEGPKGKLEKMEAIQSKPLDVVGRTRSFRRKVSLDLDPDMRSITKDLEIDVFVPIRREYVVSVLNNIPVKILGNPKNFSIGSIEPEVVNFALSGPKIVLDSLTEKDILAFVDVSALEKGDHDVILQFKLPSEVVLNQNPPTIKVKVS